MKLSTFFYSSIVVVAANAIFPRFSIEDFYTKHVLEIDLWVAWFRIGFLFKLREMFLVCGMQLKAELT